MSTSSRFRTTSRLGRWSGLLLIAALLPLLGPTAAPAFAADCTSEATPPPTLPPDFGCDDVTPPDTQITAMSPSPNDAGWTKTDDVTFEFSEVVNDADQGPWTFMCKLTGASQAHDWETCESPKTYTDLADSPSSGYEFFVYAVDAGDSAISFVGAPVDTSDDEDPAAQPDDDSASPASRTWKQDTVDPVAFIFEGPYDSEGTGWPIVKKPEVSYLLDSNEDDVSYRCQLDGKQVACDEGPLTLGGLTGGNHTFTLSVTDVAGNSDESAETEQFVVPYNLTKGKNWAKKNGKGYFAGDYLRTSKAGARVKFRAQNIREFRVVAPAGSKLGKIRVRTGTGFWKTYDLSKGKATKYRYIVVRDAASPLFSGRLLIESLSRGKQVRVDALVFPPS